MSRYQINDVFAGRYRLVKHLGMGGFSQVWKAEDQMAERVVQAVKIFAPDRGLDQNGIKLFRKEYALTVALNHPHLLKASYFDVNEGSPYLILPYCEQGSLYSLVVDEHVFEEREVAQILLQISDGLAYLHGQGILHQDVKPDNIFIRQAGHYVLADFGISTKMRRTVVKSMMAEDAEQYSAFTPAYAPPEKYTSKPTPSGDVFSLGVTLYELLTHDVPFDDIGRSLKGGGTVPRLPERYGTDLNALVQRCVSLDPSARPTAEELREVARRYLDTGHWKEQKKTKSSRKPDKKPRKGRVTEPMPTELVGRPSQPPPEEVQPPVKSLHSVEAPETKRWLSPGKIAGIVGVIAIGGFLLLQYLNQQQRQDQIDAFWLTFDTGLEQASTIDDSIAVYETALLALKEEPLATLIEADEQQLQEGHDALIQQRSTRAVAESLKLNVVDIPPAKSNAILNSLLIPDYTVGVKPSEFINREDLVPPIIDTTVPRQFELLGSEQPDYFGGCDNFHINVYKGVLNGVGPHTEPSVVQTLFSCPEGVLENNVVRFTAKQFFYLTAEDCIQVLSTFPGTLSKDLFNKSPEEVERLMGRAPVIDMTSGNLLGYRQQIYRMRYGGLAVGFVSGDWSNQIKMCSKSPDQVSL